jgi:pimeloyl-ACP methyl ester carboxylesterase
MTTTWAARFDGAPRLIDVGGRAVCAQIRGSGPTVVLEAAGTGQGIGGAWGRAVEEGLTGMATVVSYDRAGVGSSAGPPRRTITEMADDLHDLLETLALPGPAVVVSWSYGGLVSALHAVRHPRDVAGLVLVDPTQTSPPPVPGVVRRPMEAIGVVQLRLMARRSARGRIGARTIERMAGEGATDEIREQTARFARDPAAIGDMADMLRRTDDHLSEVDAVLSGPGARFPDVPTTVLAAGVRPPRMPRKYLDHIDASHRRLAGLAPRGRVVVAEGATHQIPYERPDVVLREVAATIAAL